MATSYLDKTGLEHLWGKIKNSDDTKVDKNQGSANADKYLGTDSTGVVTLRDGLRVTDDGNGTVTIVDGVNLIAVVETYDLPVATPTTLGGVKPVTKTADMSQEVGVDENGLLYTNASAQSDWNEDIETDPAHVLNRPAIRAGDGENSVIEGRVVDTDNASVIYTLQVSGDANATVYNYTTTDELPSGIILRVFTQVYYENEKVKAYNKILDIDKDNNTIKLLRTLSSSAISNETLIIYCRPINKVVGKEGHAEGQGTIAALSGHTEGRCTYAGQYSHAEGSNSFANVNAHAEGSYTLAEGTYSHAEGYSTKAFGESGHSEGGYTIAQGVYSHSEGHGTIADKIGSHSEGSFLYWNVTLEGEANATTYNITNEPKPFLANKNFVINGIIRTSNNAFSLESNRIIDATTQDGYVTSVTLEKTLNSESAINNSSYYMLVGSHAIGNVSHAEGASFAYGDYSHSENIQTIASGDYSHAEGQATVSTGTSQHVQGKFNIVDTSNTYADIVGNGTTDSRSNAYTLDWNGNGWYAGKLTVGTGPTENMDVATKQYVDAATAGISPNLSGLSDTNISSPATGQILTYDGTTSKWVNTTSPYMTASQVNELIAAALAEYGDGDTASYGFEDASEVSY